MAVRVVSIDSRAAELLDASPSWSLVARFERAMILARDPGGDLISVVRCDVPDGPFTARLDESAPRDLRTFEVAPRLDHVAAVRWTVQPVPPVEAVDPDELLRRFDILDLLAERAGDRRGGWEVVLPVLDLVELEVALATADAARGQAVAARLAGLGPGLTPTGDDCLAGALATHAWAEAAGLVWTGAPLRRAIALAAASRTTRLAGQLLEAAATGEVATPLARVLASLLRRTGTFPPDLAPLLAVGETSGSDMLAGVRLAGRALRRAVRGTIA